MNGFIEVVGKATLVESVVEYNAEITVNVRASRSKPAVKEVAGLCSDCIRRLRDAGFAEHEVREGGSLLWRPWVGEKKVGQAVSQRLLVSCTDMQRLTKALGSLEPLFKNERYSLFVSMERPLFKAGETARRDAERAAIGDAKAKALNVAGSAGLKLGGVTQVEELGAEARASGAFGDTSWSTVLAAKTTREGGRDAEGTTRHTDLRFRVRFSVTPRRLAGRRA